MVILGVSALHIYALRMGVEWKPDVLYAGAFILDLILYLAIFVD